MICRAGAGVLGTLHERQRDHVRAQAQRPAQVIGVLAVRAGTLTRTPGRLRPLWSETWPPVTTRVRTRGPPPR